MKINSTEDGKFYVRDEETGRTFLVEPLGLSKAEWGDVVNGKVEGSYGQKHIGSVKKSDSVITADNGFKNIIDVPAGESPFAIIEKLLKK